MRVVCLSLLAALVIAGAALPQPAVPPAKEELADKVRVAIERGVRFLRDKEGRKGFWEENWDGAMWKGGWSSLAILALLNSGVPANDPVIVRGLERLRRVEPRQTYVVALQTMVFVQAGYAVDRDRITRNVDWLLKSRIARGWTYGPQQQSDRARGDFSNTQYALLGLHEGIRSGVKISEQDLAAIQSLYLRSQHEDGSWGYVMGGGPQGAGRLTMTTAGLCGLLITGMDMASGKQVLREDGSAENCGVYEAQKPVVNALQWIGNRFPDHLDETTVGLLGNPFYCLYGLERAGRLSGQRFIGGNDWYRIGCEHLVKIQDPNDGSWKGPDALQLDSAPIIATSFSLLFLSKGRTPVLLTKLAYGSRDDEGWNNKHNDARNLVEFASRELFKKQPLAWQIFDTRGLEAGGEERVRQLTGELLQSPILYFNGHDLIGWSGLDTDLLREYVANGGFVIVENCCGKARFPRFDQKIRELLAKTFETPLEPLAPDHSIYVGKYLVSPGLFPLEGIQQGCKTVLVYSSVPLAGYWEANLDKTGRGRKAFELGANIIAYATGLEPPKPRLTGVEVFSGESVREDLRRGFLKVAQLEHNGDWHPAPKAMRNLMAEVRKSGLDVALQTRDLAPSDPNLFDYRFMYMHGRKSFTTTDAEKKNLRFLLKSGGLLFADACCGSKAFDASFRSFMEELWAPDRLKLEPIPIDDPLYGSALNGAPVTTVRCRREGPDGKHPDSEYRDVPPALEGVKIDGRWAVIYSRYDLGCALEKHPSGDCLGHTYESAVLLGKAVVQYALRR